MTKRRNQNAGFSLMELLIAMTVLLVMMGIAATLFSKSMAVRARESRTTDALASAYAALNVMSREISNSGFGLKSSTGGSASNGIIIADSSNHRIHIRSNFSNVSPYNDPSAPGQTNDPGEDVTYYFDAATNSIVRYDPHATPTTSVVVNKISNVTFNYYDYSPINTSGSGPNSTPTALTGRVVIDVKVQLDPISGQPNQLANGQPLSVSFSSEVNLRNSHYMLQQY
jgi:prepilin-type N-terminal cleavage/methylation domain-containing protein